jgi:hypothetical protein
MLFNWICDPKQLKAKNLVAVYPIPGLLVRDIYAILLYLYAQSFKPLT